MKEKYKSVPYDICLALVDRHIGYVYGSGRNFYEDLDNAVVNLSKTIKKNIINKTANNLLIPNEYWALQRSGMMYEFFPNFTGNLGEDKEEFSKFWFERENKIGWIDLILK